MRREKEYLASVLLAGRLLGVVASRNGLSVGALRVLGLVAALADNERVVSGPDVAKLLGHEDSRNALRWGAELRRLGMIEQHRRTKSAVGWRVLPAGRAVLGLLEREERATRRRVASVELKAWPRRYTKSAAWYAARGKEKPGAE